MRTLFAFSFSALVLAGCGGGGDGGGAEPPPSSTISGTVFASAPFKSGDVRAYDFSTGEKGAALDGIALTSRGQFELTITGKPKAVLIEVASGCYVDKALRWDFVGKNAHRVPDVDDSSEANVCTSAPSLSAAVPFKGEPTMTVAVTPYTHAAVGLAQYQIRANGKATDEAVRDANGRLSAWVGANIITTIPARPVRSSATVSEPLVYGSLLAGMPTWIFNLATDGPAGPATLGEGTATTLGLAEAMKSDFLQDGVLNGTGRSSGGNPVALKVGNADLSTSIYRHQIAVGAVLWIRAATEGARDATLAEAASIVSFLPALSAYNDSTNPLLDESAVIPLDEGGPVIKINVPVVNATLRNNMGMDASVYDIVGIRSGNTSMLIDGVHYTYFSNQYRPNNFINTPIFSNGPHTLTVKTTNNLGSVISSSVEVKFLN